MLGKHISNTLIPWKSKTKQRMVFRMIHVKDSRSYQGAKFGLLGLSGYSLPNGDEDDEDDEVQLILRGSGYLVSG